jgi:sn-glycerol 3-phosphate transport system permease protein
MTTESIRAPIAPRRRRRRNGPALLGHFVLGLVSLLTVVPIVWMYVAAWRPPNELFSGLFPSNPSTINFTSAFQTLPFGGLVVHTLMMAAGVSLGQLLSGLLAAYALATYEFRGKRILFLLVVATWLIPFQVTMLPNYVMLSHLGLLNSVGGVIVPQLSSAFAILLLRQHLNGFPRELLEAARVDGQSSWAALWKVVVPNLGPALAALEILLFVGAWNEYFWPLLVYHQPDSVLQMGISNLLNAESANYGALMAAGGLATLPILIIYVVLQRHVVNAFVRSGLK